MPLPATGRYFLINVYTKNYAKLPDANEGSSVIGHSDDGGNTFKVGYLIYLSIVVSPHANYATVDPRCLGQRCLHHQERRAG